jgi:hypothetical protein
MLLFNRFQYFAVPLVLVFLTLGCSKNSSSEGGQNGIVASDASVEEKTGQLVDRETGTVLLPENVPSGNYKVTGFDFYFHYRGDLETSGTVKRTLLHPGEFNPSATNGDKREFVDFKKPSGAAPFRVQQKFAIPMVGDYSNLTLTAGWKSVEFNVYYHTYDNPNPEPRLGWEDGVVGGALPVFEVFAAENLKKSSQGKPYFKKHFGGFKGTPDVSGFILDSGEGVSVRFLVHYDSVGGNPGQNYLLTLYAKRDANPVAPATTPIGTTTTPSRPSTPAVRPAPPVAPGRPAPAPARPAPAAPARPAPALVAPAPVSRTNNSASQKIADQLINQLDKEDAGSILTSTSAALLTGDRYRVTNLDAKYTLTLTDSTAPMAAKGGISYTMHTPGEIHGKEDLNPDKLELPDADFEWNPAIKDRSYNFQVPFVVPLKGKLFAAKESDLMLGTLVATSSTTGDSVYMRLTWESNAKSSTQGPKLFEVFSTANAKTSAKGKRYYSAKLHSEFKETDVVGYVVSTSKDTLRVEFILFQEAGFFDYRHKYVKITMDAKRS